MVNLYSKVPEADTIAPLPFPNRAGKNALGVGYYKVQCSLFKPLSGGGIHFVKYPFALAYPHKRDFVMHSFSCSVLCCCAVCRGNRKKAMHKTQEVQYSGLYF